MREFFRQVIAHELDFNLNLSILAGILMLGCSLVGLFGTLTEFRQPRDYPRRWLRLAVGLYFFTGAVAFLMLLQQRTPDDPVLLLFVFILVVFIPSADMSLRLIQEDSKERSIVPLDDNSVEEGEPSVQAGTGATKRRQGKAIGRR